MNFGTELLQISIANLLHSAGFDKCTLSANALLTDVYIRYLDHLAKRCSQEANHQRRNQVNYEDVFNVLTDTSMDIYLFKKYVEACNDSKAADAGGDLLTSCPVGPFPRAKPGPFPLRARQGQPASQKWGDCTFRGGLKDNESEKLGFAKIVRRVHYDCLSDINPPKIDVDNAADFSAMMSMEKQILSTMADRRMDSATIFDDDGDNEALRSAQENLSKHHQSIYTAPKATKEVEKLLDPPIEYDPNSLARYVGTKRKRSKAEWQPPSIGEKEAEKFQPVLDPVIMLKKLVQQRNVSSNWLMQDSLMLIETSDSVVDELVEKALPELADYLMVAIKDKVDKPGTVVSVAPSTTLSTVTEIKNASEVAATPPSTNEIATTPSANGERRNSKILLSVPKLETASTKEAKEVKKEESKKDESKKVEPSSSTATSQKSSKDKGRDKETKSQPQAQPQAQPLPQPKLKLKLKVPSTVESPKPSVPSVIGKEEKGKSRSTEASVDETAKTKPKSSTLPSTSVNKVKDKSRTHSPQPVEPVVEVVKPIPVPPPSNETQAQEGDEEINCICEYPHLDNGLFMIACDVCGTWFHGDCLLIRVAPEFWKCPRCK
ncbi:hypothetical protein HDU76_006604 [Blyttiomyces sp. JEL0837]|nr:hypothetical protein HDU76_006604 [Blyttiomyces sp. JEL0837]